MITASVTLEYGGDPKENLARAAEAVKEVTGRNPETELIVFGEMITGWYDPGSSMCSSITLDNPALKELCSAAAERSVNIVVGISELSRDRIYNSLVLIDSNGKVIAVHRKRNLKKSEIEAGYIPGDHPVTCVDIQGLKTGMVICSDAADPVTVKTLMKSRLDLIILILADDRDENRFMARCNARLYDAWIVTANRFGYEGNHYWNGHSVISDPYGRIREYSAGKKSVLSHDVCSFRKLPFYRTFAKRISIPFLVLGNLKSLRSYM